MAEGGTKKQNANERDHVHRCSVYEIYIDFMYKNKFSFAWLVLLVVDIHLSREKNNFLFAFISLNEVYFFLLDYVYKVSCDGIENQFIQYQISHTFVYHANSPTRTHRESSIDK